MRLGNETGETIMHKLYMDVSTSEANMILRRIKKLKDTLFAESDGAYHQCRNWSRLYIETTKTEEEMDDWSYRCGLGGNFCSAEHDTRNNT